MRSALPDELLQSIPRISNTHYTPRYKKVVGEKSELQTLHKTCCYVIKCSSTVCCVIKWFSTECLSQKVHQLLMYNKTKFSIITAGTSFKFLNLV